MSDFDPVIVRTERHLVASRWWRKHSVESANGAECRMFADNLQLLADDMKARPSCYPATLRGSSDWETYKGLIARAA